MESYAQGAARALPIVHSPRPLSDHTLIVWQSQEGGMQLMYLKMDKSWMREERFKVEVAKGWLTQPSQGLNMARLAKRIDGL